MGQGHGGLPRSALQAVAGERAHGWLGGWDWHAVELACDRDGRGRGAAAERTARGSSWGWGEGLKAGVVSGRTALQAEADGWVGGGDRRRRVWYRACDVG